MILADYHIHSYFSGDSEETFEEIVKASVLAGLKEICITDHQDFGFMADGILFELEVDEYYQALCRVSEQYADTLTVKIGVETGLEPDKSQMLHQFANAHEFDFVIGSTHLVDGMDPYYPEFFQGKTDEQAFARYFESILESLDVCSDFDVYGHIDYIVRYSPNKARNYSYEKYHDMIDAILRKLIHMGKGIEVNTCGYRYGLGFPNPCKEIVRRYHELGGEIITVGSDAHVAQDIGYDFKKVEQLLSECGFDYYTVFSKRVPAFVKL